MDFKDNQDLDPLFVGMTRPPLVLGVPMEFFGINFILFGIGMIAFAAPIRCFLQQMIWQQRNMSLKAAANKLLK